MRKILRLLASTSFPGSGFLLIVLFVFFIAAISGCQASENSRPLILATTTSVENSGLLDYLLPEFEQDTGIKINVIAQGTGQAAKTGENGDADVLLMHDKKTEEKFVSEGHGVERIELMYNYFIIAGPKEDPAGIKTSGEKNAANALKKIMKANAAFISRGDESGTHKKEISLWKSIGILPSSDREWYISAGKGMGDVLAMASEKKAYTLTDKATYLSMKERLDLQIVLDGAEDLLNQYTVIAVNPDKHKNVNKKAAEKFIKWITSKKALDMINEFGRNEFGESLFMVNYKAR